MLKVFVSVSVAAAFAQAIWPKGVRVDKHKKSWGKIVKERHQALQDLGGPFLDVGCSTGDYVHVLNAAGETAVGVDIAGEEKWKNSLGEFSISSVNQLPFNTDAFETAFSFEVLEHVPEPVDALKELARVSRNNVLISVPNCDVPSEFRASGLTFNHYTDPTHVNFFTRESVEEMFSSAGLSLSYIRGINRVSPELLHYRTQGFPAFLVKLLAALARKNPLVKNYHMTLLALGHKKNPG